KPKIKCNFIIRNTPDFKLIYTFFNDWIITICTLHNGRLIQSHFMTVKNDYVPFFNSQSSSFLLLYSHLSPVASSNEKLVTFSFISILISQSSFSSIVFNGIPAL